MTAPRRKKTTIPAAEERTSATGGGAEDPTGGRSAAAALRVFEAKYRALFENIDDGFGIFERVDVENGKAVDYRIVEANRALERHMGIAGLAGRLHSEIAPQTQSDWLEIFNEVLRTGESLRFENYRGPTGRWLSVYASRVDGVGSGLLSVLFTDITERKLAGQAMEENLRSSRILHEFSARVMSEENIQTIYDEMTAAAMALTHADAGTVQILDERTQELVLMSHAGIGQEMATHFRRISARSRTSCAVALSKNERTFVDFDAPGADPGGALRRHREAGLHAAQSTPLVTRLGKPIGMVSTHWRERQHRPSEQELRFIDLLARQAADLIVLRENAEVLRENAEVLRENAEVLRENEERLRGVNALLEQRLGELEIANQQIAHSRTAALNLMEDAMAAREEAERSGAALRESEDRLRTLADAVPQIIWSNSSDGTANYFNRRWYEYSGLSYEESAGPGWEAIVHPEDAPRSVPAWKAAVAAGEIFDTEYRLRGADNRFRWFIGRNVPMRDITGRVIGWFGTATDIHDLKQAEAALRASEEQFRRAIEHAPIPVIMHAEDGQVLQISKTWTELTGYTPKDIPTFDGWLTRAYGPGADELRAHVEKLFRGEMRRLSVDFDVITRSGDHRGWSFSASAPGRLADGRRFIVGMALDITERQLAREALTQSREQFQLVIENAREYAIFSMDLERRVTIWNSGAHAILGYGQEEVIGQSADLIFTPEDRAAGAPEQETETALAEGRAADERWHLRKDGSRFWGSGVMTAMHDSNGRAIGLVKIFRDQTEELRAMEALEKGRADLWQALQETERARDEAQAATKAKDHFLAVLSHELRTPLTPVLMAVDLLSRSANLDSTTREALDMIRRNVDLEADMIKDLLDVTRIGRGKFEITRVPLDFHEVIERAIVVSRSEIDGRQQRLTVACKAEKCQVQGDFGRLQQAVWNLLKNASKFTPEGGEIFVQTRNLESRIVLEVTDTGIGMEAEALSRIFEPFTQGNAEIAHKFGGLGLGLTIAKAAVDAHGGMLQASSDGLDRGATFTVALSLAPKP